MNFIPASTLSLFIFIVLYFIIHTILFLKLKIFPQIKIWAATYFIITFIICAFAFWGITESYILPVTPILLVTTFAFCILFSFSKQGLQISRTFSFTALLGFQSFRFPLEVVLHHWGENKVIPMTMTWSGQNIDVIAGIICLLAIPFFKKSISLVWAVQLVSFGLLMNVLRVAIMSSPFPFSWGLENPLLLMMKFPYALIVPGFVGIALICHLLAFRKLLHKNI